jgi:zinc protease
MFINKKSRVLLTFIGVVFMTVSTIVSAENTTPRVVPIEHWQMKNGMDVYFVSMHEIPIIDVGVVFAAGSSRDGDHAGLAMLTNAMLDEGTKQHNADQIAQSFEDVGAKFSSSVELDYAMVSLRSMSDRNFLEPATTAFADVINNPIFPQQDFKRLQQQVLRALQEEEQEPGTIAEHAFYSTVYNGGPYGKPSLGTVDSVRPLSAEDVSRFYRRHYTASNAHLVLVGDLKRADAEKLAEKIAGGLSRGEGVPKLALINSPLKAEVKNIRFPSAQTHVLIGQRAISRLSPDYFPLVVGNQILGGGVLTSRLYKSVREKGGLAYSVYSYFDAMKMAGPFMIGLQTRNEQAKNAIKIARETLASFVSTGPTEEELTEAKNNIINGFALRLASNRAILQNVVNITTYGLPLNYLDTYRDNINGVSSAAIKAAFQQHINPKGLVTITVGNSIF